MLHGIDAINLFKVDIYSSDFCITLGLMINHFNAFSAPLHEVKDISENWKWEFVQPSSMYIYIH